MLTPGQGTPTDENKLNESNHDFSQLIQSISDEIKIGSEKKMKDLMAKNEDKMKEIVERIKKVSISKEECEDEKTALRNIKENGSKDKVPPKRKKRKLATKCKTEILKEYEKLIK